MAHTKNYVSYNTVKKQGEHFETNEGESTKKVEFRTEKKYLAMGETCMAIFFNGRIFVSSGLTTEGTLGDVSAFPPLCDPLYQTGS